MVVESGLPFFALDSSACVTTFYVVKDGQMLIF